MADLYADEKVRPMWIGRFLNGPVARRPAVVAPESAALVDEASR